MNGKKIKVVSSVKILGIRFNGKLNFSRHVSSICKSAANQLNVLIRLKGLVNTFTLSLLSNFNYFHLVWMLPSASSLIKGVNLRKRALKIMLNDYESSYDKLLSKSGKCDMNFRRKRTPFVEIYKILNGMNPSFL